MRKKCSDIRLLRTITFQCLLQAIVLEKNRIWSWSVLSRCSIRSSSALNNSCRRKAVVWHLCLFRNCVKVGGKKKKPSDLEFIPLPLLLARSLAQIRSYFCADSPSFPLSSVLYSRKKSLQATVRAPIRMMNSVKSTSPSLLASRSFITFSTASLSLEFCQKRTETERIKNFFPVILLFFLWGWGGWGHSKQRWLVPTRIWAHTCTLCAIYLRVHTFIHWHNPLLPRGNSPAPLLAAPWVRPCSACTCRLPSPSTCGRFWWASAWRSPGWKRAPWTCWKEVKRLDSAGKCPLQPLLYAWGHIAKQGWSHLQDRDSWTERKQMRKLFIYFKLLMLTQKLR